MFNAYNSEIVLQKIRPANSQTPPSRPVTPPPPANPFSGICDETPRRCEQVVGQARTLLNTFQQGERLVHRKFRPHLERFIRGSLTSAFTHYLLDRDLDATFKEAPARAARKKLTGRVAQKGRVIILREVRGRITKRAEDEVEKARNAVRRAEIAAGKKEKAEIIAQKRTKKALFKEVKAYLEARPQLPKSLT
ncbi:hypothetical protein MMC31_008038 [Peltigera leucophlebia]|nr:hypothetical protein [Peltigera leucophlebia]